MYCECNRPELADGYSVSQAGTLMPALYCSKCDKPYEENKSKDDGGA